MNKKVMMAFVVGQVAVSQPLIGHYMLSLRGLSPHASVPFSSSNAADEGGASEFYTITVSK